MSAVVLLLPDFFIKCQKDENLSKMNIRTEKQLQYAYFILKFLGFLKQFLATPILPSDIFIFIHFICH